MTILPPANKKNASSSRCEPSESAGALLHETKLNRLLAALPLNELKKWLPELELIEMPLGHVLYETGATETNVYFPTTAIVSLLYVMENGDSVEIAVVGNEGIVGISLFMGG